MKKLIICLCLILLISGCSKKQNWQDVEENFTNVQEEVEEIAKTAEEITQDDYQSLLQELTVNINKITYSQESDNQDVLIETYKAAQLIEVFASMFNGNCAQELIALATNSKDLVKSVYDGNETIFDDLKSKTNSEISNISTWAKDQWSTVEKRTKVLWNSVSDQITNIETEAKNNLTNFGDIAENELEDLKHTILDNYDLIKNGVTKEVDDVAKQIYNAAYKLEQYTRRLPGEEADKVWNFAKHIEAYVKQSYGKVLEEGEIASDNIESDIEAAKKWTQSTWNEITKELKLLVMPNKQ